MSPIRLAIFSPSSPGPVRRQSRVEIYQAERKVQKKGGAASNSGSGNISGSGSKFSLKNLFKSQPQLANSHSRSNSPGGEGSHSALQLLAPNNNKFIDKEHEREILERQGKGRPRPEIIHPLDLQNGGVEVVKITPKAHVLKNGIMAPQQQGDRKAAPQINIKDLLNSTSFNNSNSNNKLVVKLGEEGTATTIIQSSVADLENKDSGHDSSSIQTEGSDEAAGDYFSSGGGYPVARSMPQVREGVEEELGFPRRAGSSSGTAGGGGRRGKGEGGEVASHNKNCISGDASSCKEETIRLLTYSREILLEVFPPQCVWILLG